MVGVAGQPRIPTELFALDQILNEDNEKKPEVLKEQLEWFSQVERLISLHDRLTNWISILLENQIHERRLDPNSIPPVDKVVDQIVRELAPSSSRRKNEDPDLMSDLRRGNLFLTKVVNNLDKEDGRGYTI